MPQHAAAFTSNIIFWLLIFRRGQHSHTSASNTGNSSIPPGSSCSGKPLLEEGSANSPHCALQQLWSARLLFQERPHGSCRFWKGAAAQTWWGKVSSAATASFTVIIYQCALSAGEPLLSVTHTASSCQLMLQGRDYSRTQHSAGQPRYTQALSCTPFCSCCHTHQHIHGAQDSLRRSSNAGMRVCAAVTANVLISETCGNEMSPHKSDSI